MTDRSSALGTEIFGVDVQSGDIRGDRPTFAFVRYDGSITERDTVSARKLRSLIDRDEPAIIAIDNVFELAPDKDQLVRFLRSLPDTTKLVQVTGDERPEPLSRVANRHDVVYDASPMGEAEASARLAASNVGHVVRAFEDRTIVRVTRGRSPGKGGSSEDRYTRRIHGSVKRKGREVTDTLDETGLAYERTVTEKYGGWARAEFEVEAPPEEVPISAGRGGDVRVEVSAERSGGIRFEPLAQRRELVMVGIDPGTSTAVGIVDLDGTVLDVWSSRTVDTSDVVEWIIDRGKPLIVAADVAEMPDTVDQIRRSFDAAAWTPEDDLPVDEKLHRCRDRSLSDDHQRDALAAALFAYDDHADQLARIAEKTPPGLDWQRVAELVIAEELSIEAATDRLTDSPAPEPAKPEPIESSPSPKSRRIRSLSEQVTRLQSHVDELRGTIDERDDRIDDLEHKLEAARSDERRRVRHDREVTRLRRERDRLERELEEQRVRTEELEEKVERMKALWRLDHSDFAAVEEERSDLVPVKPVEKFTLDAIEAADEAYGLARDDVIYLRDASGAGEAAARRLVDIDPRVVLKAGGLTDVARRTLLEGEVPLGEVDDVAMQEVDELAVARESDVEAVVEEWSQKEQERRLQRKRQLVDELIDEHREGHVS